MELVRAVFDDQAELAPLDDGVGLVRRWLLRLLRLVSLVLAGPGQEACICDLTGPLGLSQPTVSHHMKVLVDAGLLTREKRGRWAYFRAVPEAFESLAQALQPASSNVSERRRS